MPKIIVTSTLVFLLLFQKVSGQSEFADSASSHYSNGNLGAAVQYYDLAAKKSFGNGDTLAFFRYSFQSFDILNEDRAHNEVIARAEQLSDQFESLFDANDHLKSMLFYNLGNAYSGSQSDGFKGLAYLKQAERLERGLRKPDKAYQGRIEARLASGYYYNGQYDSTIIFYKRVLARTNNNPVVQGSYMRGIGNAYWGLGKYQEAADYFEQSIQLMNTTQPVDSLKIGLVLHSKGYIYMDQEAFDEALYTFKLAHAYMKNKLPEVHPSLVWILGDIGRAYLYDNQYDSALRYIQEALISNTYNFDGQDIFSNPPLKAVNDEFQQFMILKLKGESLSKKYLEEPNDSLLKLVIETYELADKQVDKIREGVTSKEDLSNLTFYSSEIYYEAVENFIAIANSSESEIAIELAHKYMEKQRVSVVYLRLQEMSTEMENNLPQELLQQEKALKNDISDGKSAVLKAFSNDSDSIDYYEKVLFDAQRTYENFQLGLKKDHRKYHEARYNVNPISLQKSKQYLALNEPNTAIITYLNFGERLIRSILTKDSIRFDLSDIPEGFEKDIQEFRTAVADLENNQYEELAKKVGNLLVADLPNVLPEEIEYLVVIPSPLLQTLPFELLQLSNEELLFEQYVLSYHYAIGLMAKKSNRKHFVSSNSFLGVAPDFSNSGSKLAAISRENGLSYLPGAEKEVKTITNLLGGTSLFKTDASEGMVKQSLKGAGLLHFATHAVVDQENPEASYLLLDVANDEDGKLHFFEIYNLDLDAQLVTLSACNTGFGKILRGEGVMSLSRAFAYAGVPATVVSLWPASDKSTPELMEFFYQNLTNGQRKDEALNNARNQYLAQAKGKGKHPFYWGGFVLIGDTTPLESTFPWWMLVTSILLLTGGVFYFVRRVNRIR